jgi:tetratricopeptide (TPR) repeat protein
MAADIQEQNADTYEALISLIENSQGRLAPIIVACDDYALRQRLIDQYELEAAQAKIRAYRVRLGQEPSVRAALAKLKEEHDYLRRGGAAVFTVTGTEMLLRVTLKPEDEQSELDKFFGYLQWTREGLREFRYPIVLWVTHRILKEMSRRAPDFWSWRKAVLRFAPETEPARSAAAALSLPSSETATLSNDFLPPLEELQAEIQQLEASAPESPILAALYDQLGQVYANRVRSGKATDLEQEQAAAIAAWQTAIQQYQQFNRPSAQADALNRLGNFLKSQSRFNDAIDCHQQSLAIRRRIGDRNGEGGSLCNLGNLYQALGQDLQAIELYQQAVEVQRRVGNREFEANSLNGLGTAYISLEQYPQANDFYQQSLDIYREIGDRNGEAKSLGNLGNVYGSLGQYSQAFDVYQQVLAITREIGDLKGAASSLNNLGTTYKSLEQYPQAIDCLQQSLAISREIGDRNGEARSLLNIGNALARLDQHYEALQSYKQALAIYEALGLDHRVEECKTAIAERNKIIAMQRRTAPSIGEPKPSQNDWCEKSLPTSSKPSAPRSARLSLTRWQQWGLWLLVGLAIVLIVWWLR